jgi:hypothetical protein
LGPNGGPIIFREIGNAGCSCAAEFLFEATTRLN